MSFWLELKYALRLITRKSAHSIMCVLVVAMSLGLSLVVFSLVYNTSYKKFDFDNSERWVYATEYLTDIEFVNFADSLGPFVYQEMRQSVNEFAEFGAIRAFGQSRFTWNERTTVFNTLSITPNLLRSSNISPILGRSFLDSDSEPNSQRTVLLSYSTWQNYFGGDISVIGEQTLLDEQTFTIVGVMPEVVPFPVNFDLMTPLILEPVVIPDPQASQLTPMGILKEGVSLESADNEIQSIMVRLRQQYPDAFPSNYSAKLRPLNTFFMETASLLFAAMAAVTLVILFLACLNIANLLLSQSMERGQEFAIRNAVGSSRWLLIRQSLLESLVICLLGAVIGLILATIGLTAIDEMFQIVDEQVPSGIPPSWVFALDRNAVISSIIITAAIWIASGLLPAWMSSRPDVDEVLKAGSKGTTNKNKFRLSKILVGFEIFSSCFLLVVCGVLLLAIDAFLQTDYGFALEDRMVSEIEFPTIGYEEQSSYNQFIQNLQQEAELQPEIRNFAVTSSLPFSGIQISYAVEDMEPVEGADYPSEFLVSVSNNFFETVDVEILEGRAFDNSDTADSLAVVIVDENFARRHWPNESAIGKRIQVNPENNGPFYTIVGVNAHTLQSFELFGASEPTSFYRPYSQRSISMASIVVETDLSTNEYQDLMQEIVFRVDRSVAIYESRSFEQHLNRSVAGIDLIGRVFLTVSLLTLVLAGTGIFAIISRSVIQRIRESGIRRALGSTNVEIINMYLRQGMVYLATGVIFGGACALLASNALSAMFTDLMSYAPYVLTSVVLGMAVLIAIASWLPSTKAVAMEPGEALHYE